MYKSGIIDDLIDSDENKNFKKKFKKKPKSYCGNCGKFGHFYKQCHEPITSFGIICTLIVSNEDLVTKFVDDLSAGNPKKVKAEGIRYNSDKDMETFCKYRNNIKFLMIQRKHTLGYIEFVRGRYSVENVEGIIFLFRQMTSDEIKRIGESSFDELWNSLWVNKKNIYHNEYNVSKSKFERLKNESDEYLSLEFYVDNVTPTWDYAEWGFPKGRRTFQEDDKTCAIREFNEESGFIDDEYTLLNDIVPIEESFIGTNGISYRHIYYWALSNTDKMPTIDSKNMDQLGEIGAIGWYSYDEAMKLIRPYHTERRRMLTELYMYILNHIVDYVQQ